ncbi:MAG TPA: DUF6144 family protein [Clostridia bacterium]|nr:DUF6144 family protein [Clostridia bacterium]
MNRRAFLSTSLVACGCCKAACNVVAAETPTNLAPAKPAVPLTPDAEKVRFTKIWVSRLMDNLDAQLDLPSRQRLMEACGRTCFIGAHGEAKPKQLTPEQEQDFLKRHRQRFGENSVRKDGEQTVLDYWYEQNPRGLKVSEGFCLCPVVEDGPEKLSPTYCHCSVGYVKEMFRQMVGRPVQVQLLRSVRRGDRECRFEVRYI